MGLMSMFSKGGGGSIIALDPVTNFIVTAGDTKTRIQWTDPENKVASPGDITVAEWGYTRIIRKVGSAPTGPNDGVLVLSSEVKNQYSTEPFEDTSVANNVAYYYAAYAYTTSGVVSEGAFSERVTPKHYAVYGVKIDLNDSDPETSVVYTDEAEGLPAAYIEDETFQFVDNGWMAILKEVCGIRPCVLKDGVVQYYLNPDNYGERLNGGASNIGGNNGDGDVMVEFDHCYINLHTDESYLYVQLSKGPVEGFVDYPFRNNFGVSQKHLYLAAFASADSLGSISGAGLATKPYVDWEDMLGSKSSNYRLFSHTDMTFMRVLYLLLFKNLDSKRSWGQTKQTASGVANTKGLVYGEKASGSATKLLGLENLVCNNSLQWIQGLEGGGTSPNYVIYAYPDYKSRKTLSPSRTFDTSYIRRVYGDNDWGFIMRLTDPIGTGGSATTYFCDVTDAQLSSTSVNIRGAIGKASILTYTFGGAGIFSTSISMFEDNANYRAMARLAYCGGEAYEE